MLSPINGKTCLVTGGAGFLGKYLIKALLSRNCRVRALDRLPQPSDLSRVEWVQGDIQNAADLERATAGVEIVFHTVAMIETLTHAPQWFKTLVWNVNVEGTRLLLQAAERNGCKRFINTASTNVVFGQKCESADESTFYSTSIDLYSASKAESERMVLDADTPGGMRTCSLRPGGIYGPGERSFMIGPITEQLLKHLPISVIGNGKSLLDYVYIDNLIDAQLRAAERLIDGSPICGRAYFITDNSPINPGAFSLELVKDMGIKARTLRLPRPLALVIAWCWERFFQFTSKSKPKLSLVSVALCTQQNYFSIAAAQRDLGYTPQCDTHEGLRRTAIEARSYYDSLRTDQ